jgi:hypothetical protein
MTAFEMIKVKSPASALAEQQAVVNFPRATANQLGPTSLKHPDTILAVGLADDPQHCLNHPSSSTIRICGDG